MHFSPEHRADPESNGKGPAPYMLVVDPDDQSRTSLLAGLRAGTRTGTNGSATLIIEAGATAKWARDALGRSSPCAAVICDARIGTLDALSMLDEVRSRHQEAVSMVIGPMSDHGLVRACAQRLAIYAPSPADPVTLAALAGTIVNRLNSKVIEAKLAAVASSVRELRLTRRQADVFGLLVRRVPAGTICAQLDITRSTYRKHVATILVRTHHKRTADLLESWERSN